MASLKRRAAELFERCTGHRILNEIPAGLDLGYDLGRWLPEVKIETIIDVGANTGQSALAFARQFPCARIHSLEPGQSIFETLLKNTATLSQVTAHCLALGARPEERTFVIRNTISHIVEPDEDVTGRSIHPVVIDTLDRFCERIGIGRVSLLKIDTEGHDLKVLQGGERLLQSASIDCLQVEAGLDPANDRHVPLNAFQSFLQARGYLLFGFYEQTHARGPQLRRADVAFISPRVRQQVRHS